MIYKQDTMERCIFAELYDDNPLGWCEKRTVDTVEARKKTKALIKKCNKLLSLLDEVEEK